MAAVHKARPFRRDQEGDYIASCSCGWVGDPKPAADMAKESFDRHAAEAASVSGSQEAADILAKLDDALARVRGNKVPVVLTVAEAAMLRSLLR